MSERNMNDYIFNEHDPDVNLDIKTELRFSKKSLPKGESVPIFVDGKKEYISIPLDIKNGSELIFEGRGKYNPKTGQFGDLYVEVYIEKRAVPWKIIGASAVILLAAIAGIFFVQDKPEPPPPTIESCTHIWLPADCTTPKTCSECNEKKGTALGHKWVNATCTEPKTCKTCGKTEGMALGHQWVDATYFTPKTCSICKETEGDVLHNPIVGPIQARLPIVTYAISSSPKIYGYEDSELTQKSADYYFIPYKDEIVIEDITKDGTAMEIRYPSSVSESGYRTLWFPTAEIIPLSKIEVSSEVAKEEITTYRYSNDGSSLKQYGRMDPGNEYVSLGRTEAGHAIIVYTIYRDTVCNLDVREKIALIK